MQRGSAVRLDSRGKARAREGVLRSIFLAFLRHPPGVDYGACDTDPEVSVRAVIMETLSRQIYKRFQRHPQQYLCTLPLCFEGTRFGNSCIECLFGRCEAFLFLAAGHGLPRPVHALRDRCYSSANYEPLAALRDRWTLFVFRRQSMTHGSFI